jgi:pimeloyl-ACP methyl ester carboxylesterase
MQAPPVALPLPPPHALPHPVPVLRDVSIRGVRVRFAEAGAGPALILVHGYLASHATWEGIIAPLATRFRVIAPDLPGFGDSEKPPPSRYPYTLLSFAESLVDLVAALDLNRASVVGQTMGSAVALTMAVTHPHIVEKLVLVTPDLIPHGVSPWERAATAPVIGPLIFKQVAGKRLFLRYLDPVSPPTLSAAARVDNWFHAWNAPAAREAAHAAMLSMQDTRSLLARLGRANVATLVCGGGRDDKARLSRVRQLSRELPNGRLLVFDSGRAPEEEVPREFAREVTEFLTETPPGSRA